jgi:hypothetical protein
VSDKGQSRRFRDVRDRCPYSKCRSAQKVDPFGSELGPPVRFYFAAKLRRLAKDRWGHDWKPIGHLPPRRFTGWDFERPGPVFGGMSEGQARRMSNARLAVALGGVPKSFPKMP